MLDEISTIDIAGNILCFSFVNLILMLKTNFFIVSRKKTTPTEPIQVTLVWFGLVRMTF